MPRGLCTCQIRR